MKNKKLILISTSILGIVVELFLIYIKFANIFQTLTKFAWISRIVAILAVFAVALIWGIYKNKPDRIAKKAVIVVVSIFVVLALVTMIPFNTVKSVLSSDSSVFSKSKIKISDEIKFGHYGGSDIEWLVLDIKNNNALIISKDAIDARTYNDENEPVAWENSSIRVWLNKEFYEEAFSISEQEKIIATDIINKGNEEYGVNNSQNTNDRVFLLSIEEADLLFNSDDSRICQATDYAKNNGAWNNENGVCWWWLRTPGYSANYAATISAYGFIKGEGKAVNDGAGCVRPVMWVKL